jgi:lipopolysaccharide/colanic/teichoic acid biosynthesis glycosyltransferase
MDSLLSPPTPDTGTEVYKPLNFPDELKLDLQPSVRLRLTWFLAFFSPYAFKRSIDLIGALVALLLLAPLMLAIALLIRLDSPGPVLFRQLRRGYRGRLFWVLKFRTMVVDAEQRLRDLEKKNESAGGVLFKLRDDPRVTPLGRFLRRSSLDELPQLINVLRGEMSLVGPRPLQLRDSDKLQSLDPEGYTLRLQAMPGLTGPWQVGGRSEVDYAHMVKLDLDYVKNRSLIRDLQIILRTFVVVLVGRGAY